jgi:peroxiredoxin
MKEQGPFGRRSDAPPPPEPPAATPQPSARPARAGPRRSPSGPSNLTWVLGVVCVLGLGYLVLNAVQTDAPGSDGVAVGRPLPPFAAPLAGSTRRCDGELCDPNVAREAGKEVRRAACQVSLPDVLNVCALAERGPVVLAFLSTASKECRRQVDVLERVRRRFPRVQMAAVSVRGDRTALRRTVRERGWTLPVAHDTNGAVANAYGVSVCPSITFAQRGGRVQSTSLEFLDERALGARVERLVG